MIKCSIKMSAERTSLEKLGPIHNNWFFFFWSAKIQLKVIGKLYAQSYLNKLVYWIDKHHYVQ